MNRTLRRGTFLLLSSLVCLAGDLTITYKSSTKGMGGNHEGVETQLMSGTKMRTNTTGSGHRDSFVDLDAQMVYQIDHDKKVLQKASFQELANAFEAVDAQMSGQMGAMMANIFGDMSTVSVEATGKESILGRNCNSYKLTAGKIVQDLTLDPSLTPPLDMSKAMKMTALIPGPMGGGIRKMYEKMKELKGIHLKTHMSMMGMDITREATAISQSAIPASAWALPTGYKETNMADELKKMGGGRSR